MLRRVVERSGAATRQLLRERNGAVAGRQFQQPRRGFAVDKSVNWDCFGVCGFLGFSARGGNGEVVYVDGCERGLGGGVRVDSAMR
jgi:hypothetical protein